MGGSLTAEDLGSVVATAVCFSALGLLLASVCVRRRRLEREVERLRDELAEAARRGEEASRATEMLRQQVAEQAKAEETARLSERHLRDLVENINAVVFATDVAGRITYISPAVQKLFQLSPEELVGQSHLLLVHPDDRAALQRHLERVFRGVEVTAEHRLASGRGETRWVRLSYRPVWEGNRLVGAHGLMVDITRRREAAEQRERLLVGLTSVIGAADRLMRTGSLEEMLRAAVEVARERLGVERAWIVLLENGAVRGTYGTNFRGETTDERSLVWRGDPYWEEAVVAVQRSAPRCWVKEMELTEWNGLEKVARGVGWVAHTAIGRRGERPWAIFCNDSAVSGRPLDSTQQQVISLYCSFLAALIEHKRMEEALRRSETRFREFAALLPQVVFEMALDGRITFANESAYRLLGYTHEEVAAGLTAFDVVVPEDVPRLREDMSRLLAGVPGPSHGTEYTLVAKDGRRIPVIADSSVIEENGEPVGLRGILVDITERKRAEEEIRKLVRGLRAVFRAAAELIRCDSLDELYRRAVELARSDLGLERCAIFLREAGAIRGTYGTNLRGETTDERSRIWTEERGEWEHIFAAAQGSEPQWCCLETTLTEWDGREARPYRPGWVAYTALASAGSESIGIFCNDTGISGQPMDPTLQEIVRVYCSFLAGLVERKRIEEALRAATEQAQIANRLKSQIMANVSHELRTPLNSIIGFTEQILQAQSIGPIHAHARTVLREASSLLNMINSILEHARLEAGTLELRERPVDVRALVERAAGFARTAAREKGLGFRISVGQDVPPYVMADGLRLAQVLANLLDNAVKFTHHGHVELRVRAGPYADERLVLVFSVTDTGVGIPPEKQEAIFESFTQADGSTTRAYRGLGLGLTIARRLVHLMGGEIGVESRLGQGSTFWVRVPLRLSPTPPETVEEVLLPEPREGVEQPVKAGRILLAEDYPPNREIAQLVLEQAGHHVDVVSDGAEAVAACAREPFDLIILDVHMPGMDGFEAARRIRAQPGSPNLSTPIVALTASADADTQEACRRAGMTDVLTKPIRREFMLAAVNRWLRAQEGCIPKPVTPVAETKPEDARFDYARVVREFGNAAVADQVLQSFFKTSEPQLRRLREAVRQRDAVVVNQEAHRLRGAAANLTATGLAEAARRMEEQAAARNWERMEEWLAELERAWADMQNEFHQARGRGVAPPGRRTGHENTGGG